MSGLLGEIKKIEKINKTIVITVVEDNKEYALSAPIGEIIFESVEHLHCGSRFRFYVDIFKHATPDFFDKTLIREVLTKKEAEEKLARALGHKVEISEYK